MGRALRIGGAVALLVAGLVHLDLYFGGYRDAGSVPSFGRSILFNADRVRSVGAAVAARREWYVRLAGIILPAASLAALAYTHTGHTLFGFQGDGFNPSPQAQIVLVAEIAAIVLLARHVHPVDRRSGRVLRLGGPRCRRRRRRRGAGRLRGLLGQRGHRVGRRDGARGGEHRQLRVQPRGARSACRYRCHVDEQRRLDHSVVADDDSFRSDELGNGSSYEFTFDAAGEYSYVCGIHPEMSGTVIVSG